MGEAVTDLTVIILVGNEELHIRRCLERLAPLRPRQILVVESQTGDRTHDVAIATAKCLNWRIEECLDEGRTIPLSTSTSFLRLVFHPWPGNQAAQFNWALDHVGEGRSKSEEARSEDGVLSWILRLDADEYLTEETCARLRERLEPCRSVEDGENAGGTMDAAGLTLELKRRFCGGEIRHATTGIRQVRLFRRGHARYDEGLMDERLVVDGTVEDFDGVFVDDSLVTMDAWRAKHREYAKREAAQAVESLKTGVWTDPRKAMYYRMPPYFRAFAYFCIRYFLKGGFLDGRAGWMWNFWQGLWYRWIVDREIGRGRGGERKS